MRITDTKKVIYFLNVLRSETSGHDDELNQLYNLAVNENDEVVLLKAFLDDYSFYNSAGKKLKENVCQLLNDVFQTDPNGAVNTLRSIRQMNESLTKEVSLSRNLLYFPEPFSDEITVVPKKDAQNHIDALRQTASAAVYLMLLYSGIKAIRELAWPDNAGLRESIYRVNTMFLPRLMRTQRPKYSWVVRLRKIDARLLQKERFFELSREYTPSVERSCASLRKEPMGTHAFLNVDAYESNEAGVPFCWGIGNLVSADPSNALSFLTNNVATSVRKPSNIEYLRKMPKPMECLSILTDKGPFCISPDELVRAMNLWIV